MSLPSYVSGKVRDLVMGSKRARQSIVSGALLYSTLFTPQAKGYETDVGFCNIEIDKDGEMVRRVQRASGDDTTEITERNPKTGQFETHRYTPIRNDDGTWRMAVDLPRVYNFVPKGAE